MEYRQLGRAGVRVSVIGLGTNRFGAASLPQNEVNKVVDAAQDLGINFIDTSDTYTQQQSEETLGHALKGRWDRFVVATKFVLPVGDGPNDRGASRYHMMHAVEASLRRLQSDHIDLYYIHRWDPQTPIEETLRGLDDLVRQGKICYVGVSDFAAWQLAKANTMAELKGWSAVTAIQSEYYLLERYVEQEVLPYCQAHNVAFIPYYPLAGGFLTGKYRRGEPAPPGSRGASNARVQAYMTDAHYDAIESLTEWAKARGRGLNELAQAWLLAQPLVCSVISGATRLDHVLDNAKAAEWGLSEKDVAEISTMLRPS
ncbi:aldo/keto reductase [Candidatus Entotheonella palauensis]|uniref:aldo/keto reductase n=1 Tax=Candidatus Entotheonella palauensis TaxID=93172 RepID=UPI000B7D395D|nr:aldo/keto reductase [Candidatus Entotheonella palauensis]